MECNFCEEHSTESVLCAGITFYCCPQCAAILLEQMEITYYVGFLFIMCCECGVLLSGPFIGKKLLKAGKPNLALGFSHGICHECCNKKLLLWRAKRI